MNVCPILNIPELSSIVSTRDPDHDFHDLDQVGHGNFGAVFCAKKRSDNSVVAIKKIQLDKKNLDQKISEVINEIKVLKDVNHINTVQFYSVYWKNNCVVMEYCIGSLIDVMNVMKAPFDEPNILYITNSVLKALIHIHSLGWIHRDVKCANILITDKGIVKMADFGSSSLKSQANTFIGSPYWMSPEVILAMEDGLYDQKSDVWSLGISVIELAEMKPPRFEMNAMSALYFIAQNESPTLSMEDKWSPEMNSFVSACLLKDVEMRPLTKDLMKHDFMLKQTNGDGLMNVIKLCYNQVEAMDHEIYNKIKTIVHEIENDSLSDSSISTDQSNDGKLVDKNTTDYSNSTASLASLKRAGAMKLHRTNTVRTNTIRLTSTIVEESFVYEHDGMQQNLEEYRQLRKSLIKQLTYTRQKLKNQKSDVIKAQEKQLEFIKANIEKNIDKLKQKHNADYEQMVKSQINFEKKLIKTLTTGQKNKHKSMSEEFIENIPEVFSNRLRQNFERISQLQKNNYDVLVADKMEKKLYWDALIQFHETTSKLKQEHNRIISKMKLDHMNQIHEAEMANLDAYAKKSEVQLRKKHLNELKSKPKTIKSSEAYLRKAYMDQVRTHTAQYKRLTYEAYLQFPKEQYLEIKQNLKRERIYNLTKLESELLDQLAKHSLDTQIQMDTQQEKERDALKARLMKETSQLSSSQDVIRNAVQAQISQENHLLEIEIGADLKAIEQRIQKEKKELDDKIAEFQLEMDIERSQLTKDIDIQKKKFSAHEDGIIYPTSPQNAYLQISRSHNSSFRFNIFKQII